jgi:signal transduction histidine kinase
MTKPEKFLSDKQEYLKDIIIHTLTSDDLDAAIRNISMELGKLFNADRVHFRFFEESTQTFSEIVEEYRRDETIPTSKGKIIYPKELDAYLKDKLKVVGDFLTIYDINKSEYPESVKERFQSLGIKNEIILPIFYRNKLESAFFIANTEASELLLSENLEFLLPIAKQISIGTHLFKMNENLNKTAKYEEILREAVFRVRLSDNPDDVLEFMANSLADLYKVNKVINLHLDSSGEYVVIYEALKNSKSALLGTTLFKPKSFKKMADFMENSIVIINDTDQIEDNELKSLLNKNDIRAFMLYPVEELFPIKGERKIEQRFVVCSDIPRKWSSQDIETLKLIIGTLTVIYTDIRGRKEVKEIEETFTASLVHDLKSPIYAEQKALEFLMSRKADTTIKSITPYLHDMYLTNEELLRLITNLLTVYSMDLGQHEIKKESANINKIIDDAIRTIKPFADDNESKITKNIQKKLMDIYIDPDEIKRVCVNLISNAITHNAKGVEINILAKKKEDEILVSISDNGVGISEAEKANIFQKYRTTKRNIGSGLGLYLSKQIIEHHHNGKMWYKSEEGKGTTFYFTLPLTTENR